MQSPLLPLFQSVGVIELQVKNDHIGGSHDGDACLQQTERHSVKSALFGFRYRRNKALYCAAKLRMPNDEMYRRRFALGHHDPLPFMDKNLQIAERGCCTELYSVI